MELSGRIFVTSDTHFGEDAIRRRFGRDFDDIETMDQCLIDGINEVVRPDDVLLHLGDFIGNLAESRVRTAESVRDRIACRRIILVRGKLRRLKVSAEDPRLAACVEEALRGARMPRPDTGEAPVSGVISFQAS